MLDKFKLFRLLESGDKELVKQTETLEESVESASAVGQPTSVEKETSIGTEILLEIYWPSQPQ